MFIHNQKVKEKRENLLLSQKVSLNLKNIFYLLLLLSFPFQLGRHFWPRFTYVYGFRIDYLSPAVYLQDLILLVLMFLEGKKLFVKIFQFIQKKLKIFFLFLIFIFFNIFSSINKIVCLIGWFRFLEIFILIFLVSENKNKFLNLFLKVIPIHVFIEFFLTIFQVFFKKSFGGIFWFLGERSFNYLTPGIAKFSFFSKSFLRPYGTFSHPNSLAGYFLVIFLFLFFLKPKNVIYKISLFCCLVIILLSFSQTIWTFITILFFFILIDYSFSFKVISIGNKSIIRKNKTQIKFSYFLLFILIFAGSFSSFILEKIINSQSLFERNLLIKMSLQIFLKKPFFGSGLNNFILGLSFLEGYFFKNYLFQPVHNIYFLVLTEGGIFIFLLFIIFIKKLIDICFVGPKTKLKLFITFGLISIYFTGLFDHYWITLIQNRLLFSLLIGLIL